MIKTDPCITKKEPYTFHFQIEGKRLRKLAFLAHGGLLSLYFINVNSEKKASAVTLGYMVAM